VNGSVTATGNGLTAPTTNGGSLISKLAVPDGASDYEVKSTLRLTATGGTYYSTCTPPPTPGPPAAAARSTPSSSRTPPSPAASAPAPSPSTSARTASSPSSPPPRSPAATT
jgi:hypothetical protein